MCRKSQPLPAADRPPAQKQRTLLPRLRARNRPRNPLAASEPLLRPAPAPALPKLRPRPRAQPLRLQKQAMRQRLARARLLLPRLARQKDRQRAVRGRLNRQPAAHPQQHLHRAAQHLHSQRAPLRAARPPNRRADPPRRERLRSATRPFRPRPGPGSREYPRNALAIRSAVEQPQYQGNGHSRAATASAPAMADIPRQDARPIEGHHRTLAGRARPHPRTAHQSGASTRSKKR